MQSCQMRRVLSSRVGRLDGNETRAKVILSANVISTIGLDRQTGPEENSPPVLGVVRLASVFTFLPLWASRGRFSSISRVVGLFLSIPP